MEYVPLVPPDPPLAGLVELIFSLDGYNFFQASNPQALLKLKRRFPPARRARADDVLERLAGLAGKWTARSEVDGRPVVLRESWRAGPGRTFLRTAWRGERTVASTQMWVRPGGKSLVFQTLGAGEAPGRGTADLDGDAFVLRWADDDGARHELRAEAVGEDRLRLVRRRTAGGDDDAEGEAEELWSRTYERRRDG